MKKPIVLNWLQSYWRSVFVGVVMFLIWFNNSSCATIHYSYLFTDNFFGAYRKFARLTSVELQFCWAHLIREVKFLAESKDGCTQRIVVPILKDDMIHETKLFFDWYNEYRPHMTLNGKTPNEVYYHRHAANAKPRIETRPKVKHSTPCAKPRMCIAGKSGTKIKLRLEFLEGRLYLPIIRVERI